MTMDDKALAIVEEYIEEHLDKSDPTWECLINWICALNEEQRELLRHNIYSVSMTRGNGFKMIHMYIWFILKQFQNIYNI